MVTGDWWSVTGEIFPFAPSSVVLLNSLIQDDNLCSGLSGFLFAALCTLCSAFDFLQAKKHSTQRAQRRKNARITTVGLI
jgi:hypothetical protein